MCILLQQKYNKTLQVQVTIIPRQPGKELSVSPTLSLKSPENFRKFTDREVPVFATFVKRLSLAALRNYLF
jgi:hypothetical protein